tara:strand:- start:49 stop:243 length:195 start_codon:yes stop_codon:yes gene_type:complete
MVNNNINIIEDLSFKYSYLYLIMSILFSAKFLGKNLYQRGIFIIISGMLYLFLGIIHIYEFNKI